MILYMDSIYLIHMGMNKVVKYSIEQLSCINMGGMDNQRYCWYFDVPNSNDVDGKFSLSPTFNSSWNSKGQ